MKIQSSYAECVQHNPQNHYVLGFEYDGVLPLGKRVKTKELPPHLFKKFQVEMTERGGLLTLHNCGQLVIYPIISLRQNRWGVREFIQKLHLTSEQTFQHYDIPIFWDQQNPQGLFTKNGKIAFCGIRIVNGVSIHGMSLNIQNSLSDFDHFQPCGACEAKLDSLEQWRNTDPREDALKSFFDIWIKNWCELLDSNQ